jgi:hypothetical protein
VIVLLRLTGASLIGLAAFHLVLARVLDWRLESTRLSALNARVFAVHAFFVAFVLAALGLLTCARPDLLTAKSELARLLLGAIVVFWICRLFVQSWVFDPVLWHGKSWRWLARIGAHGVWLGYTAIYGALWWAQF